MTVISAKITFRISWAASLKDKRQVRRSIVDKTRQKFNVSVAEVESQDIHQRLTLGLALVSGDGHHARQSMEEILRFMEDCTEAETVEVEIDD